MLCSALPGWWQPAAADRIEADPVLHRSKCSTSKWLPAQEVFPGVESCAAVTEYLVTSLEADAR